MAGVSNREAQRKMFNADCDRITNHADHDSLAKDEGVGLRHLAGLLVAAYQSYPLLCRRNAGPEDSQLIEVVEDGDALRVASSPSASGSVVLGACASPPAASGDNADSSASVASGLSAAPNISATEGTKASAAGLSAAPEAKESLGVSPPLAATPQNGQSCNSQAMVADDGSGCQRTIAVCFNRATRRVTRGLSGKLRHQGKTHASLWGKSLLSGRPRGNCAEFRVANTALMAGEKLEDLGVAVVDLMSGAEKPRCRNCLCITQVCTVYTDNLVFDGDQTKVKRKPQSRRPKKGKKGRR